ncbi:S41 family peptidase [Aporhodopirellula aestuarii]|uniref:S41 family peptidase n=1 Tax=Aporhodopirellula aestuarii TaxID=2950107 RepID=A0ABT0UFF6_9BACT|nr:S41 family peptidase [Aporhodopirellula aestuarii]MCM2375070.1 S41 family peptidase [Aporhodopirellula aestuarii]
MLPRNLTIICITLVVSTACHVLQQRTHTALLVGEALEMIDRYYVEPVDDRQLILSALAGMTATLDQHSEFIPPVEYRAFQDTIQQEFAGIGIYVDQPSTDGPVRVITPLVGSPALAAGVLPGDEIIEVDGEVVATLDIREVSERLRGPVGTTVDLTLRRGDEEVKTTIVRDRIQMESVIGDHRDENNNWVYRLDENPRVAYVRMTSFGDKTVSELESVLRNLNNDFDAFVLDLRGNGGGLLNAAVEVADMFLNSGKIVSTKTRGGRLEEEAVATQGTLVNTNIPMAILIDHDSASASEIVTAALQDHGRAIVGGTRSFGKGTVQNILPLEYGRSALRLTVAKYFRPSDQNIHRGKDDDEDDIWGVTPDEGLAIEMDLPSLRRLMTLWQEASYPSLKGIDRTAFSSITTEASEAGGQDDIPEDATVWMLDKPLAAVVQRMLPEYRVEQSSEPEDDQDTETNEDLNKAA